MMIFNLLFTIFFLLKKVFFFLLEKNKTSFFLKGDEINCQRRNFISISVFHFFLDFIYLVF